MNDQPFAQGTELWDVIQQYGWEPSLVQFVGGVWRITCDQGTFALKQSKASREKLLLLHKILDGVRSEGFPHILPWVFTTKGEPVALAASRPWYATHWKSSYGIAEEKRKPSSTELVQTLAHFHRLSEPLVKPYPELCTHVNEHLLNQWKEKQKKLTEYSEEMKAREFSSPFDKCIIANKEKMEHSFDFSIRGMERFVQTDAGKAPRYTLCHRRVHPSNILQEGDQFYLIDFDHAQVDTPVRDLATVMRRYTAEKGNSETPFELLEAYETEWRLQPKEKKLLALYLAYPERLMKMLHQYYEQPKAAQTEAQSVKRLEAELRHLDLLQDVVKSLWPNKKVRSEEKQKPSVVSISGRTGKKKANAKNRNH